MNLVAEIGINHNGDEKYLLDYIDQLNKTKINGITIQYRDKQFYDKYTKFALSDHIYELISSKIKSKHKLFGVAIKDPNMISFFEKIKTDFYKIIENDLQNEELMEKVLKSDVKKIYLSTGMSDSDEIKNVLNKYKNFEKRKIVLIHTTLSNKIDKVNLESIRYMKEKFFMQVAYGNHCEDYKSMLLSIPYLPESIFFYVKGNKFKKHPDDKHAINLDFVNNLIKEINKLKLSMGDYNKEKIFDLIPEKSVETL